MFKVNNIFQVMKSLGNLQIGAQPSRNTFILRRLFKPLLARKGAPPKKMTHKYFIYRLVEDTSVRPHKQISVILTENVPGLSKSGPGKWQFGERDTRMYNRIHMGIGEKSDIVNLKYGKAYMELLLPGLAVYNTPKNYAKYKCDLAAQELKYQHISLDVSKTLNHLSKMILYITMNNNQPWVLEPWHIKSAFRRNLIQVPEYAIEMPPEEIKGPSLSLHDKEFFVTVTVNKADKVNVRCRFHLWEIGEKRVPIPEQPWEVKLEPLFVEQAEILADMPLVKPDDS